MHSTAIALPRWGRNNMHYEGIRYLHIAVAGMQSYSVRMNMCMDAELCAVVKHMMIRVVAGLAGVVAEVAVAVAVAVPLLLVKTD
jgi:hypothetical protein